MAFSVLRSEFVNHVITLMLGRAGAMLVSFALIPVISRIYTPEDFGVAAFFAAVITIVAGVGSLDYPRAAILEKDEAKSRSVLSMSLVLLSIVMLLMYALLVLSNVLGYGLPAYDALGDWIWVLPLGVWIYGAGEAMTSAMTREKEYKKISLGDVSQALSTSGSRVGAGLFLGSTVAGLVLGFLLGLLVRLSLLNSRRMGLLQLMKGAGEWRNMRRLATKYKDFPLYSAPASLTASLSLNLPVFMLGLLYAPVVVGFYAMADRLVKTPMNFAGNSLRRVFLRKIAGLRNEGKSVTGPFYKTVMVLVGVGLPPMLVLMAGGEEVLVFILGRDWLVAGRYVEILAPFFFVLWVTIPVPPIMTVFRRQGVWMVLQFTALLVRVMVFGVGYLLHLQPESVLVAFVWVNVVVGVAMLALAWLVIRDGQSMLAQE